MISSIGWLHEWKTVHHTTNNNNNEHGHTKKKLKIIMMCGIVNALDIYDFVESQINKNNNNNDQSQRTYTILAQVPRSWSNSIYSALVLTASTAKYSIGNHGNHTKSNQFLGYLLSVGIRMISTVFYFVCKYINECLLALESCSW